jgi:sugar phosphate isomerase/epimerase
MTLPRLALSVIGDEIGPTLAEMISFCGKNDVKRLDMRTLEGRNLMSMSVDEATAVAGTLERAGISIPTFVSPVLKWPAPGKGAGGDKVDFAFDPRDCPSEDPLTHAMDITVALGATHIRVFSYLRYDGYRPEDLMAPVYRLVDLASRFGLTVGMENEPVCNVGNIAELVALMKPFEADRQSDDRAAIEPPVLRPLVDIGNAWISGGRPSDADIAYLAPLVDQIHLKDRKLAERRMVPVGDGDVPWADELRRLLGGVKEREVLASIETHCPGDSRNATARSVAALRRIAGEIGTTVV